MNPPNRPAGIVECGLFCLTVVSGVICGLALPSQAQVDYTIADGETRTTRLTLEEADTLTVESGGAVSLTVDSQSAVFSRGANVVVDNLGMISTTGASSRGANIRYAVTDAVRFVAGLEYGYVAGLETSLSGNVGLQMTF